MEIIITKQFYQMLGCGKSNISSSGLVYSCWPHESIPIYNEVQRALGDASNDPEQSRKYVFPFCILILPMANILKLSDKYRFVAFVGSPFVTQLFKLLSLH